MSYITYILYTVDDISLSQVEIETNLVFENKILCRDVVPQFLNFYKRDFSNRYVRNDYMRWV